MRMTTTMTREPIAGMTPEQMAQGPGAWYGQLTSLLEEQRSLCASLAELSRVQGDLVDSGDTDGLLRVLAERQVLVDRVSTINVAMDPFRQVRAEAMERLSVSDRVALQGRIGAIAELVDQIRTRDEADRAALEQRRGAIVEELTGVSRSRGALAAYGARAGGGGARMQDREA